MNIKEQIYKIQNVDRDVKFMFSDLTEGADGSVIVESGNTSVLVTAVISERDTDLDYFPLKVDFEERFYSVGAILGGRFMRREGRPSTDAVLKGRIIDRTIRPLFPKEMKRDIQIVAITLSIGEVDPDTLALLGASVALSTSQIPWNGPVSAVKMAYIDDNWVKYPSIEEEHLSDALMFVCGKKDSINMIEMEGNEIPEGVIEAGLKIAETELNLCNDFQSNLITTFGKEKITLPKREPFNSVEKLFESGDMKQTIKDTISSDGKAGLDSIEKNFEQKLDSFDDDEKKYAREKLQMKINEVFQLMIFDDGKRIDGRGVDEIRPLFAKAGGISEIIHGSGIFYRGGTHILSVLTLGGPDDALLVDSVLQQDTKINFMHHYNFPPFSVGETGRIGGFNRREIGHGMLAEKALRSVLPSKDVFPYTIRLVSEVMASNGSSSMGSVCGSTIALMDGGVPIKSPVAGIAMGLAYIDGKYKVLTDVAGIEDHMGYMDLKVAGTKNGITAMQMDIKLEGIPLDILIEGIQKAKPVREKIIGVIETEINAPRESISDRAPSIEIINISPEDIGLVIGSHGKVIKAIKEQTGVQEISIEDDGSIFITGTKDSVEMAKTKIKNVTGDFEKGKKMEGKVVNITDFGAFVEIADGIDGLVHISEISKGRVENVRSVLSLGDIVPIIVKDISKDKKISLSIKDADPNFIQGDGNRKKSK